MLPVLVHVAVLAVVCLAVAVGVASDATAAAWLGQLALPVVLVVALLGWMTARLGRGVARIASGLYAAAWGLLVGPVLAFGGDPVQPAGVATVTAVLIAVAEAQRPPDGTRRRIVGMVSLALAVLFGLVVLADVWWRQDLGTLAGGLAAAFGGLAAALGLPAGRTPTLAALVVFTVWAAELAVWIV